MPVSEQITLVRHGETDWSRSLRHTGATDVPLTERGRQQAAALAPRLDGMAFDLVLTSPLQRAVQTCELAGLGERAQREPALVEWDYGDYEGITSEEIHRERPGWTIFADGAPAGESPAQVGVRADAVIERLEAVEGPCAVFAHGHILRVLAARWIGRPPADGARLILDTGTLSTMGRSHGLRVITRWNSI